MADESLQVNNLHVASLNRLMNRMIGELWDSASGLIEYVKEPDLKRLQSYLDRYERELNNAAAVKDYDFPETKNWKETLEPQEQYCEAENEYINFILSFLNRWRFETVKCQSARQQMGMIQPDVTREKAHLTEIRAYISGIITPTQPMDFPSTSPQEGEGGSPIN